MKVADLKVSGPLRIKSASFSFNKPIPKVYFFNFFFNREYFTYNKKEISDNFQRFRQSFRRRWGLSH